MELAQQLRELHLVYPDYVELYFCQRSIVHSPIIPKRTPPKLTQTSSLTKADFIEFKADSAEIKADFARN